MSKIVVTNPMGLTTEQKARLEKIGEVRFYDSMYSTSEEWLVRCKGFDIICSSIMFGPREKYNELKNVFISVSFVGVSSFADPKILKANNVTISNSPGCNRHAVSEWIIYMILKTTRHLDKYINTTEKLSFPLPTPSIGLAGKNITILGKGNVGKRVGAVCRAFEMKVKYFSRGDDLTRVVKDAEIVVDVLSSNPSSKGLLNKKFFNSLKKEAVFISVTVENIVDMDSMLAALDEGRLAYVTHDVMNTAPGDTNHPIYRKLCRHPRVFTTPHLAYLSDVTTKIGNDMMIANVEAWVKGKPINVFGR